ncbi:MAG: MFS transporter [Opitutae bacterium]|nr:MFS transporter [Opitutae bacterium]
MFSAFLNWFKPPLAQPRRSAEDIRRLYPLYRWRVMEATYIAYAAFYVVRNNFAPVSKEIGEALHYDKLMIGDIIAYSAIAYGVGKFVMGYLADRSDCRKYLFAAMALTAALNFGFGGATDFRLHLALWTLNGFVQGMGYAPCLRGLSHWYSVKERGLYLGIWNTSHNIGGGIAGYLAAKCAEHYSWPSAFLVPGVIASVCAVYLLWRMLETPQSRGLPPVEEYKNDYPPEGHAGQERELTNREIFVQHILKNRLLWVLALANVFIYIARYSLVDWGPTYLKEVKGATLGAGGFSTLVIEFAGAAGMLALGWGSDLLGGRRGRVAALSMIPLLAAFLALIYTPKGMLWLDMVLFGLVGFFVYTPVMFSGVIALDLTSKKAVGTATGFVGLFGYVGRVIQGKGLGWTVQHYGWNAGLCAVIVCTFVAIFLLLFLWNVRPRG